MCLPTLDESDDDSDQSDEDAVGDADDFAGDDDSDDDDDEEIKKLEREFEKVKQRLIAKKKSDMKRKIEKIQKGRVIVLSIQTLVL